MNFRLSKIFVAIASGVALSGCIEVKDDSNDELTAALLEQNRILSEQSNQENPVYTVTLAGSVVDVFDGKIIDNALVTIRTPTTVIADKVAVTNGQVVVEGVPSNTSVEIVVESTDDSFVSRVFYRQTLVTTTANAVQDLGRFEVSEGETYAIEVVDSQLNTPIEGLVFTGSSASGAGSTVSNYLHVSSFDAVNGVYNITVPKFIIFRVTASIDADRDGRRDYEPESFSLISGTQISISSTSLNDISTLRLAPLGDNGAANDVEVRLSIIDAAGNPLENGSAVIGDSFNDTVAEYNAETQQYVFDASFSSSFRIDIPAFSEEEKNYDSSSVTVSEDSDGRLRISTSNSNGDSFYTIPFTDVIDIPLQPRYTNSPSNDLSIVFRSNPSESETNGLSIFYSSGISVAASNVSLINQDGYSVVRGNDSDSDTILPGTTLITGGVSVPVTFTTSLNGTKLNVEPVEELSKNDSHSYKIGALNVGVQEQSIDLSGDDNIRFSSHSLVDEVAFDIMKLALDNNSFTSNGEAIVTENTAGEASSTSNSNRTVYLFFPPELNQLQQFVLRQTGLISDGQSRTDSREYEIVRNGLIRSASRVNLVSAAENENVDRRNTNGSFFYGTALSDQAGIYFTNTSAFLSDNIDVEINSITFDYAYETKAGEVFTGSLTLPVQ